MSLDSTRRLFLPTTLFAFLILLLAGCSSSPEAISSRPDSFEVTVAADGETLSLTSTAATVRQLLEANDITLDELDELDPPGFTPLSDGLIVEITRITESFEVIQQTIPFERQFVRSESMSESDDPRIVQAGADGLQETTWRIVYRDGLESERWPTNSVIIDAPIEEIVMVGIGAVSGNVNFSGLLAYISDGVPVLLRGSSDFPVQLSNINQLDNRVFKLSPTGSHLLFTRAEDESATQINNSLWVVSTQPNSEPRSLNVENVLWADWNPAKTELLEIAYTTAIPTDAPPGWEANNDLWVGDVLRSETAVF
ncbi:MAG: G5 domain-containing protein, partial [Chloroflexota bacterium]